MTGNRRAQTSTDKIKLAQTTEKHSLCWYHFKWEPFPENPSTRSWYWFYLCSPVLWCRLFSYYNYKMMIKYHNRGTRLYLESLTGFHIAPQLYELEDKATDVTSNSPLQVILGRKKFSEWCSHFPCIATLCVHLSKTFQQELFPPEALSQTNSGRFVLLFVK